MKPNHENQPENAARRDAERIKKALVPLRRRLRLTRAVRAVAYGVIVGLCAAAIRLLVGFWLPLEHAATDVLWLVLGGVALAVFMALLIGPDTAGSCQKADALGLKERLQTAWELRGRTDDMSVAQREDAIAQLADLPLRARLPIRIPKRITAIAGGAAVLVAVLAVLPNPQNDEIARRAEAAATFNKQAEALEKQALDLDKNKTLGEVERKELQESLRKLASSLRENRDYKQGLKEISHTQQEFERIEKQKASESLARASEALRKNAETQALGEALEHKDEAALQESLSKIAAAAQNKDGAQSLREALEEALADMEGESTGDPALDEALQNLSNALASGDSQQIANALNNVSQAAQNLMNGSASSLDDVNAMLRISKLQIASVGTQSMQVQGTQGQGQNGQGQGQSGQGQGQNGQGQGQNGQGQGQGQGNGTGAGIGTGSSNKDAGYKESGGRTPMQGDATGDPGRIGQFEQIYDPRLLGGEGESSQIRGDLNADGSSEQADIGPGQGDLSGYIPYGEVVGEYRENAVKAMDRQDIPPAMRETVEQYFSDIAQ